MKIGLYFGSFNPIHIGHLIIASYIADLKIVDKVWFVVSPQNPLKPSTGLLNEYTRLHLVNLAIEEDNRLGVSDIEFKLPKPSYTIDTLTYLKEKYPQHDFFVIMGSDSFQNLNKWKNYEQILHNYKIIVYKRPGYDIPTVQLNKNIFIADAPLLDISSSIIRQRIKEKKSILYMLHHKVRLEIENNNYYK